MNKKIIALILAFATLLGCTAFAWEDVSENSKNDNAKELLYALDIMDMVTKDGYDSEHVMTRAELADVILGLNNYRDSAAYGSCFADVDESTDYAEAIATLYAHGIIAPDVNYNPDANAKYEQAVKMIVYTLGYGQVTEAQGGWLEPIMNVARTSGVTKGISVTSGTELTAEMLSVLVYNSLDCEMLKRKSINEFETIKDETLLLKKFELYKAEGIVTATEITSLTDGDTSDGRISIDWTEYDDDDRCMAPYLGMEVEIYYNDDNEIIFGYPTEENKIMTIMADDVMPNASGFGYETICYQEVDENGDSGKVKKAKVEADADVIYNGKAKPGYTPEDFKIDNGKLILIDNDGDKKAEVVIIEEAVNYVVEGTDTTEMQIFDMFGATLKLKDVDVVELYDMYGTVTTLDSLTKLNVLAVLASEDGSYVKITAYNDPVTGEVEAVWEEDGDTWATIDGDSFKVAKSYLAAVAAGNVNAKKIVKGQSGTYYLDANEKIAAVSPDSVTSWQYAFLIKAQETDEGVRYRLLMDESGFAWYEAEDRVRIDETKQEDEDRKTYFDDDNEDEEKRQTIPQMVKVQLSGEGKVKKIDTEYRGRNENEDSLTRAITTYATKDGETDTSRMYELWSVRTGRFGVGSSVSLYVHPSSAFVVKAPDTGNKYNEELYSVRTTQFSNNSYIYYNAYDVDWSGVAKAAIVYSDTNSFGSSGVSGSLIIVKNVVSRLNDDDEIVNELVGVTYDGQEKTVPIHEDYYFDADKGDIIRYELNYKDEINEVKTVFDYSAQKNLEEMTNHEFSTGDTDTRYRGNSQHYVNTNVIVAKNGGYIKCLAEGEAFADASDDLPWSRTQMYSLADATIMLYDSVAPVGSRITKLSSSELSKYTYDRNPDARVVLYSTYSQLRMVLIYI